MIGLLIGLFLVCVLSFLTGLMAGYQTYESELKPHSKNGPLYAAADIASKIPSLTQDSPTNAATTIEGIIRQHLT